MANQCSLEYCDKTCHGQGLCAAHYQQKRKGIPFKPVRNRLGIRDNQGNKYCKQCDTWLYIMAFHKSKATVDGLANWCKRCVQDKKRFSTYGLTRQDIDNLLAKQNNVCVCNTPLDNEFHIDHDHACCSGRNSCGKCVRGLLCNTCNNALGFVYDNPETLERLATYLRKGGIENA